MDSYHGYLVPHELACRDARGDEAERAADLANGDDFAGEPPPVSVGQDERRMQVRAYNYWASLLHDRPMPRIEDLAGAALPDFADHAVMLDFSGDIANPAVTMLGKKLAWECDTVTTITQLSDVPAGSLLARITDRYLQILVNAAPIGFEAEFVNQRGTTLLYRGILLPFSGDGENIAHIMGVINWKELADPLVTAELRHELQNAVGAARSSVSSPDLSAWADGPVPVESSEPDVDMAGWGLAAARAAAEAAREMEERSQAALYAAIGRAWDLVLAAPVDPLACRQMELAALIKLVFAGTCDKARLAEVTLALGHARRLGLGRGALPELLAGTPGGLKRIVRKERRLQHDLAV